LSVEQYRCWLRSSEQSEDTMRALMKNTTSVIFDFDGPICGLFSDTSASLVANFLKEVLLSHNCLYKEVLTEDDPMVIFRKSLFLWDQGKREVFLELLNVLKYWECNAAETAKPTKNFFAFYSYLEEHGMKTAIATNNCNQAVETYFNRYTHTPQLLENTFGRVGYNPHDLKPNPLFLKQAMNRLKVSSDECLMIGDSVTDFEAAKQVGIRFIGHTTTYMKADLLLEAGAEVVISDYDQLLKALDRSHYSQ
jgi:phosphoglycolate phosphatase-like HAD superfamily hydrolase